MVQSRELSGPPSCLCDRCALRTGDPRGPQQPLPYLEAESQGAPPAFAENGDLSDSFGNAPYTRSPRREESQISRSQSLFFAYLIRYKNLAGYHHDRLVLAVMALETSRCALPDNNVRGPVMASQNLPCPSHGYAA